MKRTLQIYIYGMIAIGSLAVLVALLLAPPTTSGRELALAGLLIGFALPTYLAPVKLAPKRLVIAHISLDVIAILTLRPGEAALVSFISVALGNVYRRRPWFNTLFNAAEIALAVLAAAVVYRALTPVSLADSDRSVRSALALVPAGAVLYAMSALAVDVAAAIQRRCSPFADWMATRGPTLAPHVVLVTIGAATATAVSQAPWLMFMAVAPVVTVRILLHSAMQFDDETVGIVEEIADAVDHHDGPANGRSRRTAGLALKVAQAHGLPEHDCQRVYLAARLHDVGSALLPAGIVPEGELPMDERDHTETGAAFIDRGLRLPSVAEVIRYHHERFDGQGVHSIAGRDIPLESRIVAVCEAWVTLTSEHGFRPALSAEQARLVLRAGGGSQWDPSLIETLFGVIQDAPRVVEGAAPVAAPWARMPAVV